MTTIQNNVASPELLAQMNGTKNATSASGVDATSDRFMKLLVAQMKNQDPLNPLDNAQVTSQLAQLSTVTGIDKMNATLESLIGSYQSSQSLQAAGMIGHSVIVPGNTVSLSNGKAVLGVELASPADSVVVSIKDASGKVVNTMSLGAMDAGFSPLAWDGVGTDGAAMANGTYKFEVLATRAGQGVVATALAVGDVASVSTSTKGVSLNLPGIGSVALTDVRQIL
ncbi:MAG: flagellar hook assembly protein FlgD [Glaciimonas sp.]|nr:flagellar hook assembly protein FlgD [Glaciimonas sp.]